MKRKLFLALVLLSISLISYAKESKKAAFDNPVIAGFIENCGQIKNRHNEPNCNVAYLWPSGKGVNVQLRSTGLSYDTYQERETGELDFHRLDMEIAGASYSPVLTPKEPIPGSINYKKEGVSGLSSYERIEYSNIYPDVDFVVSITANQTLKYDFILKEPSAISEIKLRYSGFESFEVKDGNLIFQLSGKTILERIPASWMTASGKSIAVAYKIINQSDAEVTIGFDIEEEDMQSVSAKDGALLIDPEAVFQWGTFYGGAGSDVAMAIDTDSLGNIFVVGTTESLSTIASEGSHQSTFSGGNSDVFIVKFNQHGLRHWATYYGGSGDDEGLGIYVNSYAELFIVGKTTSQDSISTSDAHQSFHAGAEDGFLAKFDRFGNLEWDTYLGGSGNDALTACFVDDMGKISVSGYTDAGEIYTAGVNATMEFQGQRDGLLARFNNSGVLEYFTYIGGENDDSALNLTGDSLYNVVVVGKTASSGIATPNGMLTNLGGEADGFLLKVDSGFNIQWSTYFGGEGIDEVVGIVSVNYEYFIAGNTDLEMSFGDTSSAQGDYAGNGDGFIAHLDYNGLLQWFTYLGGEGNDQITGITRDYPGSLYVVGTTDTDTLMSYGETHLDSLQGASDAFVNKYNLYGDRVWGSYFGGSELDEGLAIAVHGFTSVFLTGSTYSDQGLVLASEQEPSIHQENPSTGGNAFMARFTQIASTPPPCLANCDDDFGGSGGGPGGNGGGGGSANNGIGICIGDSILLSAASGHLGTGAQWIWYKDSCGGTDNFIHDGVAVWVSPDTTTTYFVRGESVDYVCPCRGAKVNVDYPPTITASAQDSVCLGAELGLSAEGAYTYHWTDPVDSLFYGQNLLIDSISESAIGEWQVVGFTMFGCSDTTYLEVDLLPSPQWNAQVTNVSCFGYTDGQVVLSPADSLGLSAYWPEFGLDTLEVDNLEPGLYQVMLQNNYGCEGSDSISIQEPEPALNNIWAVDAYCNRPNGGATVTTQGDLPPYTVVWVPSQDTTFTLENIMPGTYTATVTDANGCSFTETITVENLGEFTAVIDPDSIFLDFQETGYLEVYNIPEPENPSYSWTPQEGLSCTDCPNPVLDPVSTTLYSVLVISQYGCTSADSVLVERALPPPNAFVPTVFSPNGDGLNDELCILGVRLVNYNFNVFDRAGEKIYHGIPGAQCWDGTINGYNASGSFLYTFEALLEEGITVNESGTIQIVR